jgi:hypothetical protein
MAKHIFQLRRGTKYVDSSGATMLNPDGTPVRDDWTTYTAQEKHLDPLEGELVLEYEEEPGTGKKTPRLKIGDGVSTFAQLPYMSVDSFILPKPASVTLKGGDAWIQATDEDGNLIPKRYYQVVTIQNAVVTNRSKVDLQPSPEQLVIFHEKDIAFTTVNEDGQVRVCVVGQQPIDTYTMQAIVTEVNIDG